MPLRSVKEGNEEICENSRSLSSASNLKRDTQNALEVAEKGMEFNQKKMNIPIHANLTLKLLKNSVAPRPVKKRFFNIKKGRPPDIISSQEALFKATMHNNYSPVRNASCGRHVRSTTNI